MNLRLAAVLASALALLAGCSSGGPGTYKDDLVAADKAFSALSAKEGPKAAFLETLSSDAKLMNQYHSGAQGVREDFMQLPDNVQLTWEAAFVDVSSLGEMGYTWGRYTLTAPSVRSNGRTFMQRGNYAAIWKRTLGHWKVVFWGRIPDTH